MNKAIRNVALAVGISASFVMAQAAQADTLNLTRNTNNPAGTGFTGSVGGGEFGASNVSPANSFQAAFSPMKVSGYDFQTFCIEGGASLSDQQPYNWSIQTAVNGNGTPLNSKVAYLYTVFWFGINGLTESGKSMLSDGSGLDGTSGTATHTFSYDYTLGTSRMSAATDMQEAIWWLMGQWQNSFSSLTSGAREYVNMAYISTATGGKWDTATGGNGATSLGAVRILTLTDQQNHAQQDVLVLIPTGTPTTFNITPVPLPSSALMGLGLMAGIGAIGFIRRRRQTLS